MTFLSISDPQVWLLAGVSILVVFIILTILVFILNIFSAVAKGASKPKEVKTANLADTKANAPQKSAADQAAVAMALALYLQEKENSESHVLTITPTPNSAWGSTLNPRL